MIFTSWSVTAGCILWSILCLSVCDYHRGFVFGASGWVSLSGSLMSWLLISFARFQAKQAPLSLITPNPLSDVNLHITHMHTHLEDAPEWKQTVVRVCWRMMDKNGSTFEVYFGTNTLGCDGHQSFSWFLQLTWTRSSCNKQRGSDPLYLSF